MLSRVFKKSFVRDYRLAIKRGKSRAKIEQTIDLLCSQTPLPPSFRDHALKGKFASYRDCHIEPDLILVYRIVDARLELVCFRLGSHADLFGN